MVIATLATILMVGAVFFYSRSSQIDAASLQLVQSESNTETAQVFQMTDHYISNAMDSVQRLSSEPQIPVVLANQSDTSAAASLTSDFDSVMRFSPTFESIALFSPDCVVVATSTYSSQLLDKNLSFREYCEGARKNELYVSGAFVSILTGTPTIGIAKRITGKDGTYAGFVLGVIDSKPLYEYLQGLKPEPNESYIMLLDRNGKILIDTRVPLESTNPDANDSTASAVLERLANGQNSGFFESGGLVSFRHEEYITVIVGEPAAEAYRFKSDLVNSLLGTALIFSLVILAAGLLQIAAVSKSFSSLPSDLEERKKAQAELLKHKDFFQNLLTHSPTPTYVLDSKGKVVIINRLVEQMSGFSIDDVVGKHFTKFVDESSLVKIISAFNRVLDGKSVQGLEVRLFRKDGSSERIILDINPLMEGGKAAYVIATGRLPGDKPARPEKKAKKK